MTVWLARTSAVTAAVLHGRRDGLLPELDVLMEELRGSSGADRTVLLVLRINRAVILNGQERFPEAGAEASDVLREVTRLTHLTDVWNIELTALACLAEALCGQDRFGEAEAVARGNLARAEGNRATSLRCLLIQSLNGQGRYEEAVAESRQPTPSASRAGAGQLGLVTAQALRGLGRRGEAEITARRALADCERSLHPAHPRNARIRGLLTDITAADPPTEDS
ncbi:hypothetical protein ACFYP4_08960 [Streptomyces sp. NPDC005551]|uniref:hypothetical protein n=1 Tax=Streptomyces sp. NPDC005551 TaxID=3364725 RepID=UPI0036814878